MRIGTISDLHIDRNSHYLNHGETFEKSLSALIQEKDIDLLLITGDVSNHYLETDAFLKNTSEKSGIPILFVPGNHDYWAKDHGITDTAEVDAFFKKQEYSLVNRPYIINDKWAVVGTPGWYDYGYANHEMYTKEKFENKQYSFATWNDKHYVDWGMTDQEVSQHMLNQLMSDLKKVGQRQVILMTHVATHPEFVIPLPHRVYNYANAFLGAKSYEQLYKQFPCITYSIMGHVHLRKILQEKDRTYLTACLGNFRHWKNKEIHTQLSKSLLTFDLT